MARRSSSLDLKRPTPTKKQMKMPLEKPAPKDWRVLKLVEGSRAQITMASFDKEGDAIAQAQSIMKLFPNITLHVAFQNDEPMPVSIG